MTTTASTGLKLYAGNDSVVAFPTTFEFFANSDVIVTLRSVAGVEAVISRTGYTGEDGFEIYIEEDGGLNRVWDAIMESGADQGILPAGLGARDTLRLEVGYTIGLVGKKSSQIYGVTRWGSVPFHGLARFFGPENKIE